MRRGRSGRPLALLTVLLSLAAVGCATEPPVRPTSLAAGAAGGVYQPIADAIARIAKETPGLDLPLTVVLLLTTASAEEPAIYGLTKALVDNIPPALQKAHPAAAGMSTDTLLRVVTVPLHAGALRLYRERNIQQ